MVIVAVIGKIGAGKSDLCRLFKNAGFCEENFADPLKAIGEIFGFGREELYGTQEQKMKINDLWGISAREFLTVFGSEICRDQIPKFLPNMKINSTIWAQLMENKFKLMGEQKNIIIGDCRFMDEVNLIRKYGGIIIYIRRPNNPNKEIGHRSEELAGRPELFNPDYIINNIGTVEEFHAEIINNVLPAILKRGAVKHI